MLLPLLIKITEMRTKCIYKQTVLTKLGQTQCSQVFEVGLSASIDIFYVTPQLNLFKTCCLHQIQSCI